MNTVKGILNDPTKQEYATKLTLISVFLSIFGFFVSRRSWSASLKSRSKDRQLRVVGSKDVCSDKDESKFAPFDLVLLGFSVLRLGRLVAYDRIMEPVRKPFTQTLPDPSGAGDTVEPRGSGLRSALGQLISCPICAGTWISAGLVYGLKIFPEATRVFLSIMGAMGLTETLNALIEALSWTGQLSRSLAGSAEKQPQESINHLFTNNHNSGGQYYVGQDNEEYYRQGGR
jgi:hypothetical protein